MSYPPTITVVGSLNIDRIFNVKHIPQPGETIASESRVTRFGGKGANQAIAAMRAGSKVSLIGSLGDDTDGANYFEYLSKQGIATDNIKRIVSSDTGSAFIAVDSSGENTIIVHAGANHRLSPEDIEASAKTIDSADGLILQLECPLPSVRRAAAIARAAGTKVFLNPSPWTDSIRTEPIPSDCLIVNQGEAASLARSHSFSKNDLKTAILDAARTDCLVVTRGEQSTLALTRGQSSIECEPPKVRAIDTVGAGDAFAGALSVALIENRCLEDAIAFANAAGSLATLELGAQEALPQREAILASL